MERPTTLEEPLDGLTEAEARDELAWLAAEIARHDRLYHQQDAPEVSDAAYDALRQRNNALEQRFPELIRGDSPSLRVGSTPAEAFGKVPHAVPMLSLDNAMAEEEVREFVARLRRFLGLPADEPLYALAFLWLFFSGPGWVSLDHLLWTRVRRGAVAAGSTGPPAAAGRAGAPPRSGR